MPVCGLRDNDGVATQEWFAWARLHAACWCRAARDLLRERRCRESVPFSLQRGVLPTLQLGIATREDIGEVCAAGTGEVIAASEMVQKPCQGGQLR